MGTGPLLCGLEGLLMARWSRKIWLGISVATLASGSTTVGAQHAGHRAGVAPAANGALDASTSSQGGGTYLTDSGPSDTRIRMYRDIILIRGHLRVGGELIDMGAWDEALPHFLHPTE